MKAIQLNSGLGFENLELTETDNPIIGKDEVLIRTKFVSINPVDWKILNDMRFEPPVIPGTDVSGVVQEVGTSVTKFKQGDEVLSYPVVGPKGTYAEFVVAKETSVAKKPQSLSFEKAAALPVVSLTAWQALFEHGNLKEGENVLVHAAAGGVGHMATQFAKWKGAYVYGTASKKNHTFIARNGVDATIDYKSEDFRDIAKDIDLVVACIGGDALLHSPEVLNSNGRIVVVAGHNLIETLTAQGVNVRGMMCQPNGIQLEQIAKLVASTEINIEIEEVFDWRDFKEAISRSIEGRTVGKLLMQVS